METYNQHIAYINDYLNNLLSNEARQDFESKLQNDNEFHSLYEEHLVFINGLKRLEIKADILQGKRAYLTEKWLKIAGISIILIGVLVMVFTLVFKASEVEPTSNNENLNTIISDTVSTEKPASEIHIDASEEKKTTSTAEIPTSPLETTPHLDASEAISTKANTFRKRAQMVTLNTQKDTTIKAPEGTILKISKGAFINPKTKQVIQGNIRLNITEYYKLSDILMANLTTVSNGKQLETGGMLYIEALQGNTKLELQKNKPIEISFPNQSPKSGMQLFSGEWEDETINWQLQNESIEELEHLEILEAGIEVPFSVVEQAPTFPGCENADNDIRKQCTTKAISKFISRNFNTDLAPGLNLTGKQRINCIFKIDPEGRIVFVQTRAAHPRLSEEAERVINLLPKMNPGLQRGKAVTVPYSLPIVFDIPDERTVTSFFGTIDSVTTSTSVISPQNISVNPIEMDTIYSDRRGIVEQIREVMHDKDFPVDSLFINAWQRYKQQRLIREIGTANLRRYMLRKSLFEMDNTKFKILDDDSITRGGHILRVPWDETKIPTTTRVMNLTPKQVFAAGSEAITAKAFEARLSNESDTSISSRDASYYVLSTSKLGWINCDRFINRNTKRIPYKLKIKNAEGAHINMVFKSYNSILPSWHTNGVYDFQTVGANEAIILVAIQRKNGKLYYDTIDTKTEANPKIDFNFKEVTIEELKSQLEILNTFK
ncbi:energy transducer TonB [Psychroserpens sp. SPM9]|uniref:energy transducer TonB n=1 Tax=Psychroserpens sp. SPM9 TaxID=2975598 RepID=UPI0021A775F3|nr:energy transducer TonB [Psychroserpens sp. SPM9]MDG5490566.1 energy transducer TonB [Psychroserpens sp. SPM9]